MFGVLGLGLSNSFHEARCRASVLEVPSNRLSNKCATVAAEPPAPPAPAGLLEAARLLQARVDTAVNVTELGDDEMLRFLHVTNDEMMRLRAADEETALEIMKLAVVTWRPGGSIDRAQRAPLRAALAFGGGDDTIVIKAQPPRMRAFMEQTIGLDLILDELPKFVDTNELVGPDQDSKTVAMERCAMMQQLHGDCRLRSMQGVGGDNELHLRYQVICPTSEEIIRSPHPAKPFHCFTIPAARHDPNST